MQFIDPPGGKPWALLGIAGGSLLLNVVLAIALLAGGPDVADCPEPVVEAAPAVAPDADALAAEAAAPVQATGPQVVVPEGLEVLTATVDRNMAYTLNQADAERGDVIGAVSARLMWWELDLRSDLQKGDQFTVAFEWDGELAHIAAQTYDSKKLGRTLSAYRFTSSADKWHSWWTAEGVEVQPRLNVRLISDYEQITAVVNSRHRHNGVDFKAPVGEDVFTPKSGTVVRTDWNFKYNGNGVEVRYADGTLARFLHLSETAVKAGDRLEAGTRVGACGNTGRSTAPHLHYELEKNGKTLDPFEYHGVSHRSLPAADTASFEAEVQRMNAVLGTAT